MEEGLTTLLKTDIEWLKGVTARYIADVEATIAQVGAELAPIYKVCDGLYGELPPEEVAATRKEWEAAYQPAKAARLPIIPLRAAFARRGAAVAAGSVQGFREGRNRPADVDSLERRIQEVIGAHQSPTAFLESVLEEELRGQGGGRPLAEQASLLSIQGEKMDVSQSGGPSSRGVGLIDPFRPDEGEGGTAP
jgi:hypothetical protein